EDVARPHLQRGREVGLMEPDRTQHPARVPESGLEVAATTRATERTNGSDGRLDRHLGARSELGDRRHLATIPIANRNMKEEVLDGSDLEAPQPARHLRPDPLEIANRIGQRGHRSMLGGESDRVKPPDSATQFAPGVAVPWDLWEAWGGCGGA